jgi:glycosyltransferase involved in cell wall biosynthesis
MKIQLEQLDLLHPWPQITMRDGYHAVCVLVRLGAVPVGEVMMRPARRRVLSHRGLRRRIARKHTVAILKNILREGMSLGPEPLRWFMNGAWGGYQMTGSEARKTQEYVEEKFLLPTGLPSPMREWVVEAQRHGQQSWPMPAITVAVCTRDREEVLEGCIRALQELDYPEFEILVVDNGRDPVPTRDVAERCGARYVRSSIPGLSRARNVAIANAKYDWVAFTDDDCRPEKNWLKELARPLQDQRCRCVCGLVLPAQLDNIAEITFEIYGGLGRGYAAKMFAPGFLRQSKTRPAQTWRIGAGANMLLHKGFARWIGGYDVDMGPGPHSVGGCGEDTDLFYQVLRTGHNIHYAPRAIVHHFHRGSVKALRKQIHSYAVGHAAYHVRCFLKYRDHRSLIQLVWHLPRWFARNIRRGMNGKTKYPFALVFLEIRGTIRGTFEYPWAKVKGWFGELFSLKRQAMSRRGEAAAPAAREPRNLTYDALAGKQSPRAA